AALRRLDLLLQLAEQTRLYLDLTGLGCYRKGDVPAWYDALSEGGRWTAQAQFWQTVARRCAHSPAVFCYDLMNEPLSPGGQRKPGDWYSGSTLGGYDFLQFIALDQGSRPREEIAVEWIHALTRAIRRRDPKTLITIGMLPWTKEMGYLSGFIPKKIAPALDFISVHIYPTAGKVNEALDVLARFAVGKPVVIEETFPLSCSADELETFLLQSRNHAVGWMGHYNGMTPDEYEQKHHAGSLTMADAIWESWLNLAIKIEPEMVGP
ncbi:MAG: cellulase family glycosylhydrolase, partial [Armatimonadota bacterium]|nr:cellulase family glycosylhydrolase [Armatimonadota bacterium]